MVFVVVVWQRGSRGDVTASRAHSAQLGVKLPWKGLGGIKGVRSSLARSLVSVESVLLFCPVEEGKELRNKGVASAEPRAMRARTVNGHARMRGRQAHALHALGKAFEYHPCFSEGVGASRNVPWPLLA